MRTLYFMERFIRQLLGGMAVGGAAAAVIAICAAVMYLILA